jgi:hypothetical protein
VSWQRPKRELADIITTWETSKKECEGGVRYIKSVNFAKAFRQWYEERSQKCVTTAGSHVAKTENTKCPYYDPFLKAMTKWCVNALRNLACIKIACM